MDTRDLFKQLVCDAMLEGTEREHAQTVLGTHGSQRPDYFTKKGKHVGKWSHLTDEYIDSLPEKKLNDELIIFIYSCFQQR